MSQKTSQAVNLHQVDPQDWQYFLEQGGTLGHALDLQESELEAMYAMAYEKYTMGAYQEALSLFQLLCRCDHFDSRFILGLGAVRQALKEYKLAGETYSFAAVVHTQDPRFPFHTAECHLALGNNIKAASGFEEAYNRSLGKPKFEKLKEKAEACLFMLSKKLGKYDPNWKYNPKGE
ncbi:SycD/LcrH family type III secretion system chaperone [Marinibactrum halimedae]|uniref:CesD/SycD/LcrH family type III secretion system chaperone n=1 Tax=Marinibactrum halimedae TaxID=1444977 RepID=A0AA37T403_9GAMM|nr:SycD/LcrH family type III secretion system chaperone [Marinibactrum halimedae]MCD9459061.1 SycD/LcrH family type III secretion system chaperone [Marinibactrum halimedae]GLS24662.1 CesD/SycD/LcrH family type III secretion system chaperone [Marinibactrum halimedae]